MSEQRHVGMVSEALKAAKYAGARLLRFFVMRRYASFESDKRLVLLESFLGTRLDCNPKAIYDYLRERFPGYFHFIWVAEDPEEWKELAAHADTQVVSYRSTEHWKYACTAGVLVTNSPRSNEMPARCEQLQIQTWHGGGCYKKVGIALHDKMPITRFMTERQFSRYNYFISSSSFFSNEVIRKQYAFQGDILECGMPRNDRLVWNRTEERNDVRRVLGLSDDEFFVLFVPTWRDFGGDIPQLDIRAVKRAFVSRFGKKPLVGKRGHYFSGSLSGDFDASYDDFHDMQGLLLAADAVITDYSSVIWDYSFTYRPCFLFTPDLSRYEKDRGFDIDIREWGFPVCEDTDALVSAIESFDPQAHEAAMIRHHERIGSFEDGHACETVARVIADHCGIGGKKVD